MDIQKAIEWQKAFKKTYNGMPKGVDEVCDFTISALEELEQYRQIGTVDECRAAMEKMKPKKAVEDTSETAMYCRVYICPSCGKKFTGGNISNNCYHCGQALDWSEIEESHAEE